MTGPSPTADNKKNTLDSCPQCSAETILESEFGLDPICTSCGVVITVDLVDKPIAETTPEEITQDSESWTDYSKVTNSTERQVVDALLCLEQIGDVLDVSSSVRQETAKLYGEVAIANATDGRPTAAVIGAVLVLTSRKEGVPIPIRPVAEAAEIDVKALKRLVRTLPDEIGYETVTSLSTDYLPFLRRELNLDGDTVAAAYQVLERVAEIGSASGSHPAGTAAAAVYLASEGNLTQRAIAEAVGVSTETVRVRLLDCRAAVSEK
jgi:transcription initiation factor TFIIIB Brf1 subunit/transcription initiation factor TFIIB